MCKSRSVSKSPKPWAREHGELESRSRPVLRSGRDVFMLPALVKRREKRMYWTTPTLVEICIGLEINGYLPAEF